MLINRGRHASRRIPSSEITPKDFYMRRREFLGALGAAIGLGDTLTVGGTLATTTDALTPKDAVTTYGNFYEFGSDKREMAGNSRPFKPGIDTSSTKQLGT